MTSIIPIVPVSKVSIAIIPVEVVPPSPPIPIEVPVVPVPEIILPRIIVIEPTPEIVVIRKIPELWSVVHVVHHPAPVPRVEIHREIPRNVGDPRRRPQQPRLHHLVHHPRILPYNHRPRRVVSHNRLVQLVHVRQNVQSGPHVRIRGHVLRNQIQSRQHAVQHRVVEAVLFALCRQLLVEQQLLIASEALEEGGTLEDVQLLVIAQVVGVRLLAVFDFLEPGIDACGSFRGGFGARGAVFLFGAQTENLPQPRIARFLRVLDVEFEAGVVGPRDVDDFHFPRLKSQNVFIIRSLSTLHLPSEDAS